MKIKPKRLSDIVEERNVELALKYEKYHTTGEIDTDCISTGIPSLDNMGLLERGILTAVAGHTGDGKSTIAMQLMKSAAVVGLKPQCFFFEDPSHFVSDKLTAQELGESAFSLRRLSIQDDNIGKRLVSATNNIMGWAGRVTVIDELVETSEMMDYLWQNTDYETGLVLIDYAQAFDSEADEKSVERVVARLAWYSNQIAKKKNISIVLFSQVKFDVIKRGRYNYDQWCRQNQAEPGPTDFAAVEGYRPGCGDMQWSSALQQRCKQSVNIFRPGNWLRTHGVDAKDNIMHVMTDKANFNPAKDIAVIGFDGPTGRLYERRKGK